MAQSIHYTDDSNGETEIDMHHTGISSIGSLANRAVPTVFAGGPRDSHNSIGSIAFPVIRVFKIFAALCPYLAQRRRRNPA